MYLTPPRKVTGVCNRGEIKAHWLPLADNWSICGAETVLIPDIFSSLLSMMGGNNQSIFITYRKNLNLKSSLK